MLRIEKTKTTPRIFYDPEKALLILEGRSSPENSLVFYQPLLDALEDSISGKQLEVQFKLEYFNTSSVRCLIQLFKKLKNRQENGLPIQVNWYAEEDDYDLIETGEDLEELSDMEFNYIIE